MKAIESVVNQSPRKVFGISTGDLGSGFFKELRVDLEALRPLCLFKSEGCICRTLQVVNEGTFCFAAGHRTYANA